MPLTDYGVERMLLLHIDLARGEGVRTAAELAQDRKRLQAALGQGWIPLSEHVLTRHLAPQDAAGEMALDVLRAIERAVLLRSADRIFLHYPKTAEGLAGFATLRLVARG